MPPLRPILILAIIFAPLMIVKPGAVRAECADTGIYLHAERTALLAAEATPATHEGVERRLRLVENALDASHEADVADAKCLDDDPSGERRALVQYHLELANWMGLIIADAQPGLAPHIPDKVCRTLYTLDAQDLAVRAAASVLTLNDWTPLDDEQRHARDHLLKYTLAVARRIGVVIPRERDTDTLHALAQGYKSDLATFKATVTHACGSDLRLPKKVLVLIFGD